MIRDLFNWILKNFGYVSEEDLALKPLTKEKQKRAKALRKYLTSTKSVLDVNNWFDANRELAGIYKEAFNLKSTGKTRKKDAISLVSMSDLYGYKPGMSRLYGLFAQNPFALYAFISRHHPAIRSCIQVILDEITNDGFVLIAEKGVTRKRLKEVYRKN